MDLTELKSLIPEHAKDLKLNVSSVLSAEGAPGLSWQQILALALASAVAARNPVLLRQIETVVLPRLDAAQVNAARAAAAIMGMNNIYYRFVHLVGNDEYAKLPAKLRMNVIGNPGVDKADFELYSLAVSAINGCGACVAAHEKVVRKAGVTAEGVQSAVRIAAVIHGIAVALESSATVQGAQLAA
ncbi:MAG TPA: carboxymuconolactone decarboxylase family protein [Gammaproteobacteria bacterium]|nr:carboxymuconolactone decarboxylase family protein [Gammaproteobacteria bacterium]